MCVPVALASVLMYLYFARSWPYAGKVAYMFATYIFWGSICYTAINIPYGSMASVLSADAGERASLSTFRSVGAMLANLIIAAATPLFLFRTAADGTQTVIPERFTVIAVVYGVCAVACYLLCYALCRERVQAAPPREAKRQSFASLAKALAGNRALTAVIGAALLLLLASLLGQGMNMYLFKDYFNSADMLSLVGFAGVLPMLALAPFAAKLSKRFGKKEAGCVGVGVAAAAYLLMWALRLRSVWAYIGLMLVGSVGVGFFNMVIWAFITDVIDYQEVRTGSRDDGTWSRLKIAPFKAKLRGAKGEVKDFASYLYDNAGGAVLSWIIEGAQRFIANGFKIEPPEAARAALAEYSRENDWLQDFIEDCCCIGPSHTAGSQELYTMYAMHCQATGAGYKRDAREFRQALTAAGYESRRQNKGVRFYGLGLKSAAAPDV